MALLSDQVGPVQINSYAPPELLDGAEVALDVAAHALSSYNERFGPYPYSELDIVSTPTSALGVEYPGIFAIALRIYDISAASASGIPECGPPGINHCPRSGPPMVLQSGRQRPAQRAVAGRGHNPICNVDVLH